MPEPFKAEESVEDSVEGVPAGLSDAKVITSNQEGSSISSSNSNWFLS